MNKRLTRVVYPVITEALKLKERLDRGESPDIGREQSQLLNLLKNVGEPPRGGDFGVGGGTTFLGIRYALTTWIDELFIVYSAWADAWNSRKLEPTLYGGAAQREWKFWEQARLAAGHTDAVEVFFLCVVLGFRGEYRNEPGKLKTWIDEIHPEVMNTRSLAEIPDLGVTTCIKPLRGRENLRKVQVIRGGLTLTVFLTILIVVKILFF
jgi:type VI secretion system protein ImpK